MASSLSLGPGTSASSGNFGALHLQGLNRLRQDQLPVHSLGGDKADLVGTGVQLVQALKGAVLPVTNPVIHWPLSRIASGLLISISYLLIVSSSAGISPIIYLSDESSAAAPLFAHASSSEDLNFHCFPILVAGMPFPFRIQSRIVAGFTQKTQQPDQRKSILLSSQTYALPHSLLNYITIYLKSYHTLVYFQCFHRFHVFRYVFIFCKY